MIKDVNDLEIKEILENNNNIIMVFVKGNDCGVCQAAEFRINNIMAKKFPKLKIYYLDITENPLFRGQHLIFTIPTILIFDKDKEILRESRIINFYNIEKLLKIAF